MQLEMELPSPNPNRVLSEPAPTLPQAAGGMRGGANLGPAPSPEGISPLPSMGGASAPAPMGAPPAPMGETNPTGEFLAEPPPEEGMSENGTGSLIAPTDSRYADPGWTVLMDTIMGGTLPWLMAAVDVASGRAPQEEFDRARQEHEMKLEGIKQQHPQFVDAAEKSVPFLTGVIGGIVKPAQTVGGAVGRGAASGGAVGAVQGYTGADPSLESTDPDRIASAVGGVGQGAAFGAAGGGAAHGAQKMMAPKPDGGPAESGLASGRDSAEIDARMAQRKADRERMYEERLQEDLRKIDEQFTKKPELPGPNWKQRQQDFLQDPLSAFREQAKRNPSIKKWAEALNMSPIAIERKLKASGFPEPTSDAERTLRQAFRDMRETRKTVKEVTTLPPPTSKSSVTPEQLDAPKPTQNPVDKMRADNKVGDYRPEHVMQQGYEASPEMKNILKRNMTGGKEPEAPKVPPERKLTQKEQTAEGARSSKGRMAVRDNEMATLYRTKYDVPAKPIKGWQEARKAFGTDTTAFVKANPSDDLITLANKVNMSPKTVAERLRKQSLDDLPDALYQQIFEYDEAYKAAKKLAKKAKK